MTFEFAEAIADWLNRLHFVRWDRFTTDEDLESLMVYGCIDRDDDHADFVILRWEDLGSRMNPTDAPGYTTSSAKFSREIGLLLYGPTDADHYPCKRVDEHFGDLVTNKVVLFGSATAGRIGERELERR